MRVSMNKVGIEGVLANDDAASIIAQQKEHSADTALRHKLALEHTNIVTWVWDLTTDLVEHDVGFFQLLGIPTQDSVTANDILSRIHPSDLPLVQAAFEACFSELETIYDCRFRVPDGDAGWRWIHGKGQVIERDAAGSPLRVVGINYDYTQVVEWEKRLEAIAGEMRHRVKNSLAMVNALAAATARETETKEEFVERFRGRVDAIAAAQSIAAETSQAIELDTSAAVKGGLAPFLAGTEWAKRISITSEDQVPITASLGQALTLAIYELATNSVKYGVLSDIGGSIDVTISKNEETVYVQWLEVFSTPVDGDLTNNSGFGSTLISRLLQAEGGTVDRQLTPEKLDIVITINCS